jgi:integrase
VLSSSSIRHVLRVLRAALQDAVDEELLSRNVARLVQLRVTDDRKVRSFTRAKALRFLKAAEQHRLYALWAVALAMGLRRGEALGLAWSDVDLENGRLTIRQVATPGRRRASTGAGQNEGVGGRVAHPCPAGEHSARAPH